MAITSVSLQQFHDDIAAAEAAASNGPVFITEDGEPRRVLIDIAEYKKIGGEPVAPAPLPGQSLADLLTVPDDEYFDWDPPRIHFTLRQEESDDVPA